MNEVLTGEVFVEGAWQPGGGGAHEVLSPATGASIGAVSQLTPERIGQVYAAAERGARTWGRTNPLERGRVLAAAAAALRADGERLAELIVRENGKTIAEARGEVGKSAEFLEYYASMSRGTQGYLLADGRPNTSARVIYEPIGVVLTITPWNDALLTPVRKIAPALFAGNAVVLKPASDTPFIAVELVRSLLAGGLPAEAIALVFGRGEEIVSALLDHECVAAVSFTGSTEVGLGIQRRLAGRNVRVQTEMGGKNASVVCADADLELAVDTVVSGAFGQAGQRCTATSRVLVERSAAPEFRAALTRRVSALRVGDGLDAQTQVGPLISERHRRRVLEAISTAGAQGGDVVSRELPLSRLATGGFFVAPTVVFDAGRDSEIWTEEIFGPVIAVREFDDLDEAVSEANASIYGLSASIFTRSLEKAERFISEVDTGQVSVNLPTIGWDIHHPFGGFKLSGSGYKEQGFEVLNFYRRVKTAAVRFA